jgi:hypothetical protein
MLLSYPAEHHGLLRRIECFSCTKNKDLIPYSDTL